MFYAVLQQLVATDELFRTSAEADRNALSLLTLSGVQVARVWPDLCVFSVEVASMEADDDQADAAALTTARASTPNWDRDSAQLRGDGDDDDELPSSLVTVSHGHWTAAKVIHTDHCLVVLVAESLVGTERAIQHGCDLAAFCVKN